MATALALCSEIVLLTSAVPIESVCPSTLISDALSCLATSEIFQILSLMFSGERIFSVKK